MSPSSTASPAVAYLVAGMTCDHCVVAVTEELLQVAGVTGVDVDLTTKLVRVHGTALDGAALVAAIDEAGYEAVTA
jgi:copper chaperone